MTFFALHAQKYTLSTYKTKCTSADTFIEAGIYRRRSQTMILPPAFLSKLPSSTHTVPATWSVYSIFDCILTGVNWKFLTSHWRHGATAPPDTFVVCLALKFSLAKRKRSWFTNGVSSDFKTTIDALQIELLRQIVSKINMVSHGPWYNDLS